MPVQSCRFYEQEFPEVDDVVVVNVREIAEMGAYVTLLEYNNREGMILLSELSRRRIRSINKLIRVGRSECVVVLRVDKEKGYIDLSKRRATGDEVKKAEEKFLKAKTVNSILRHVAETKRLDLEELYKLTAWPLDRKFGGPGMSFEAFKVAITKPEEVFTSDIPIDEETKKLLLSSIRRRLAPQATKLRADIDVTCYSYEGVDAVKAALKAGIAVSTESIPIKINLIAPPNYVMMTTTLEKDEGLKLLQKSIDVIQETISKFQGSVVVQVAPRAVTESDERKLAELIEKINDDNEEVPGDDDDEDDDEDDDQDVAAGVEDGEDDEEM